MEKNFYAAISLHFVSVTEGESDLGNVLYSWGEPQCEVYKVETAEEASVMASQIYSTRFFSHPACFTSRAMALPAAGPFAVQAPVESRLMLSSANDGAAVAPALPFPATDATLPQGGHTPPTVLPCGGPLSQGGAWSMVWIGGYAVLDSIGSLLANISQPNRRYPHAVWWGNPGHAVLWAQREYVERHGKMFSVRDAYPAMPDRPVGVGEQFVNENCSQKPSDSVVFRKLRDAGIF